MRISWRVWRPPCVPAQLFVFALKNLVFGVVIACTACFHGLRCAPHPRELQQQTQRTIVTSLVLVAS